ncbi:MAG: putative fimbrial protein [Phycisphaerales bacterium]|jgi:prepilin-type N-terminal cleavage/methylation domain-containing protein|nr:putative fimbrial protein [Phycisphaerales bacterium]MDB5303203.1 putative fimbrial protein [Phycisphaerales bacterium]
MRTFHRPSSRGYTLIEIVVVLTIVGVLWAIAAPRYGNSLCRYRAEQAARRIAADLLLARSQAKMTSKSRIITFNTTTNTYGMDVQGLTASSTQYNVNIAGDPYYASFVSVSFNGTSGVTFDAYGSADNSGTIVVQCGGVQYTITLESTAGKVTVQ